MLRAALGRQLGGVYQAYHSPRLYPARLTCQRESNRVDRSKSFALPYFLQITGSPSPSALSSQASRLSPSPSPAFSMPGAAMGTSYFFGSKRRSSPVGASYPGCRSRLLVEVFTMKRLIADRPTIRPHRPAPVRPARAAQSAGAGFTPGRSAGRPDPPG